VGFEGAESNGKETQGLVFKAHRLLYHSTLGLRVIKKKKPRGASNRVTRSEPSILPRRDFTHARHRTHEPEFARATVGADRPSQLTWTARAGSPPCAVAARQHYTPRATARLVEGLVLGGAAREGRAVLPEPRGVVETLELVHVLHRGRLDLVVKSGVPKHLQPGTPSHPLHLACRVAKAPRVPGVPSLKAGTHIDFCSLCAMDIPPLKLRRT